VLPESLPSNGRGLYIMTQTHRESRLTSAEMFDVDFYLWSDPNYIKRTIFGFQELVEVHRHTANKVIS
jgi:hypothetical protein